MLFKAVPPSLRAAITVGIGFFITIIGLKVRETDRTSNVTSRCHLLLERK